MPYRPENLLRGCIVVMLCTIVCGCAAPAKPPPAPPPPVVIIQPPPPPDPIAAIVRQLEVFQTRLMHLPAPALAEEIARMRAAPPTAQNSVELAMALAISRVPGDTARAQQVLEPLLKPLQVNAAPLPPTPNAAASPEALPADVPSAEDAWRVMARLLVPTLAELRRLEEQGDQLAQQARDVQKRLDQVNEKLDALRAIERSLGARPVPAPTRELP